MAGLILALPVTAICKIIFDVLPGYKAVGFLLGKPQKYHFKRYSKLHAKLRSRGSDEDPGYYAGLPRSPRA
jgi:hypothetical protein